MNNLNTRFFPKGALKIKPKDIEAVEIGLYQTEYKGAQRFGFIAYSGKRSKSDLYELHQTQARRDARVKEYLESLKRRAQEKIDRAQNRVLKTNPVKVGDIFYSSWGYDQTNVDFYQVIELKGAFVIIQQIGSELAEGGRESGMSSNVTARRGAFLSNSKPLKKKISTFDGGKTVYLSMNTYSNAYPWDGRPKYSSWYA